MFQPAEQHGDDAGVPVGGQAEIADRAEPDDLVGVADVVEQVVALVGSCAAPRWTQNWTASLVL